MKRIHAVLLIVGGGWLAVVVWVVVSSVILRETRLGALAQFLDRFPPVVGTPIFILLWAIFFLGWAVLVGFGLRPLLRREVVRRARLND
jgi:threonine/homoserine/homoserine lactone efflux protein